MPCNGRESGYTYGFLHLDLIDLDPKQLVLELSIEDESVSIFDLPPSGTFDQHARPPAGQGLQRPPQLAAL